MKYIPILFSTPMVIAINEDRKTMTRREIKKGSTAFDWLESGLTPEFIAHEGNSRICPYGRVGDVLWVRETWAETNTNYTGFMYKAGTPTWMNFTSKNVKWKPSLFMPKAACRTFLEITNIRVERLEDISYKDAIAEGINHVIDKVTGFCGCDYFSGSYNVMTTPVTSFLSLWRKVNGLGRYDKTGNPWVWVIEFKKIEKPESFK